VISALNDQVTVESHALLGLGRLLSRRQFCSVVVFPDLCSRVGESGPVFLGGVG